MKKKLLFLFALICSVSLFTACNNDDPEYIQDGEFDGVYLGTLDVDAAGIIKVDDIPQKVYITKIGENKIKMELKDFSFQTLNLGTIAVENIDVVKNGSSCTFTGNQNITLLVGECAVTVKGSIEGDKLDMDIAVVAGGTLNVKVDFEGTKLAADKSSEAAIKSFKVKVGDTDLEATIGSDNTITFIVPDELTSLKFVPTIVISDKATITPASGVEQDFASPVTYTVTSEDGIATMNYTVSVGGKSISYNFETWESKTSLSGSAFDDPVGWATSNGGSSILSKIAVAKENDSHSGEWAATIKTFDTNGMGNLMPKITTGSLFLGDFQLKMTDALASTKFGIMFDKKPISVKGYYKYTPGDVFYRCADPDNKKGTAIVEAGTVDECSINAILYEVSSDSEEALNGHNLYTSVDKIVAIAMFSDATVKQDWTEFNLKLDYKQDFNPTKRYRFAIICSSSKDGDTFSGAPGSTLIVDDFELITE